MKELVKTLISEFGDKEYAHAYMEEISNMAIATQIKVLREQRNWTQKELAKAADMKQERICVIEDVDYDAWTLKTLRKLARAFDLTLKVSFEKFSTSLSDVSKMDREALQRTSRQEDLIELSRNYEHGKTLWADATGKNGQSNVRVFESYKKQQHESCSTTKAKDSLSIVMIYLRATTAYLHSEFDPRIPNQELIAQFNIVTKSYSAKEFQDEVGNKHKFLVYQTEARMRYLKAPIPEHLENDEQLDSLMVAEIVALFTSEYVITCDEALNQNAIDEFGRINVPHQVWPYWREYCQSTCARMSLPVSVMPMYVINKATEESFPQ